jgi:RNA polymerase sigma factor (sigma-70 family)
LAITEAKLTDEAVLVDQACHGDAAAFEELYRRHAQPAWRMAQAVAHNADDAADAVSEAFSRVFAAMLRGSYRPDAPFRPYLLTATRNAAIDILRHQGRTRSSDGAELDIRDERTPAITLDTAADADLVAAAFLTLPERWRSVLWLTEVEGMAPRKAADVLGLTANGTSQLAVRARAGLRERYLQAHLRDTDDRDCKRTVGHLGAYAAGTLAPRDIAKVDQHLADCADCRARLDEVNEVGGRLRALALPMPLVLGLAAKEGWAALFAPVSSTGPLGLTIPGGHHLAPWAERALAGAAAAVVTLGIVGATIFGSRGNGGTDTVGRPSSGQLADSLTGPDLSGLGLDLAGTSAPVLPDAGGLGGLIDVSRGIDAPTTATTAPAAIDGGATPAPPAAPIGPAGGGGAPSTTPDSSTGALVQVGVGVNLGGETVAVVVGDACTGIAAGATAGCEPDPAPEDTGLQVDIGGSALPPVGVGL